MFLIILLSILYSSVTLPTEYSFSLMLDPQGDAKNTGRKIGESYERGLTLQCAEKLKSILEQQHPDVRVILTRLAGETVASLQNAHFANRLGIDLYITISFYHESAAQPKLFVYTLAYGNESTMPLSDIALYSIDKAHWPHHKESVYLAKKLLELLQETTSNKLWLAPTSYSLPFKPLIGIQAPALALEIGLKHEDDWRTYTDILAASISTIIEHMHTRKTL